MLESERIKRLQSRVVYAAYLIEKESKNIRKGNITSGDLLENIANGPTSFTPVELNNVLINNNVFVPELITASGMSVPTPPRSLNGTPGNNNVVLRWSPPESDGGLAITKYVINVYNSNILLNSIDVGLSLTYTIYNLTNSLTYNFTVSVSNLYGTSLPSQISLMLATIPGIPTNVTGIRGDQQVTVAWSPPANGGSPIIGYRVSASPGMLFLDVSGDSLTGTLTGLTNGIPYTFRVVATNSIGSSSPSEASASVTPATVPSTPIALTSVRGNQQVILSWTAPNNGGSAITGYTITYLGGITDVSGSVATTTITGLTNGQAYTFTVIATNSVGFSPSASVSATPATVPSAPINVTAIKGNQQASVSWSAPNTGGSPIIGYRVTSSSGGFIDVSGLTATVTGLTNGTPYTFSVVATNAVGPSPSATSASVTPSINATAALAPTGVSGVPGNQQVTVSWSPPNDGGSPITGYRVTASPGGLFVDVGNVTTGTITGLTNGTPYTFSVVATNAIGSSAPSGASPSVTPATIPGVPSGVIGVRGNQQVVVSWTAPSDGGLPISGYRVTSSPGGLFVDVGNVTTGTVTGLTNGTPYTFTVVATNALGSSPSDASSPVTPATVPSEPIALTALRGNQQVTLYWMAPATGGSAITAYTVTYPGGFTTTTSLTATLTGLTNGTAYTFTVVATNAVGSSSSASVSATPATIPSAPTNVTGVRGNQEVAVSWTAPATGGSPITGYRVTASPGGLFVDVGNVTTGTVTGLTNGTPYTFTVLATNAVGSSLSEASTSVTPTTVPAAPTNVTGVRGDQQVVVSWSEPAAGGSPITGYRVSYPGGFIDVSGGITTATITGLTNGTSYTFTVVATNAVGSSVPSASPPVTPATIPSAPTGLTAVRGNQEVTVSWTAANDGGSPITSYRVTASPGGLFIDVSGVALAETAIVTGLTNGQAYIFTVVATNSVGSSASGTSPSVTPATAPGAATNVTAVRGNQEVVVSWTAPNNGGSPITGYRVSYAGEFTDVSGSITATITGLTNGQAYTFTVITINALGTSQSAESPSVTPATIPSAPTNVTVLRGNQQVTVSWNAPDTGGSPITIYTVSSSSGTFTTSETTTIVTGLTNGQAYTFTVIATNGVGSSPSESSASVTPATTPGAPTGVTGVAGYEEVTLSWTAPNNGGSPITSYTVSASPGGLIVDISGNITTKIFTGLTNGTSYTFTVVARNAVGFSPSGSTSVTPTSNATVPDAPINVTGVAGNGQVIVSWTAPPTGGSAITGYTVTYPGGFTDVSGNVTTATITGLTNGQAYTFTVVARNTLGSSPSASVSVTPATVPGSPTGVSGVRGNQQVVVSWTAPATGGSPITSYTVTSNPGGFTATSGETTATVTGLTNGTAYTFTVVATNAVGSSLPSVSPSVTPATVPGAPTGLTGVSEDQQVTLSWTAPNNGGSVITGYRVSYPGGITDVSGSITTATITGLTNGTAYTFTVVAINTIGTSPLTSISVTPATVPGAPYGIEVYSGNQQVTLYWGQPTNGGSAITSYRVTASTGEITDVSANVVTAIVSGLTNGTAYTFTVVAINAIGTSAPGGSESVTPATVPGAPTNVTAIKGNRSAVVSWTPPDNGGSLLTTYTVTSSPGGFTAITSEERATVSGLTNGQAYTFRVIATNSVGNSQPSVASAAVTPVAVPYPPTGFTLIGGLYGSGVIRVRWDPPVNTGDSAIISYTVISDPVGITASTSQTTLDISGLARGVEYTFSVYATNTQGNSLPSDPIYRISANFVPTEPNNVTALKGNTSALVSWETPTSSGGTIITSYTVTSSPGGFTAITPDRRTSIVVDGLTNGTPYTFTVFATNEIGDSVPSASNSVTPATVPDSPIEVTGLAGVREATISWTAPENTGSAITGYTVTSQPGGITATTNTTTTTLTGLTAGLTYVFRVVATNIEGNSLPGFSPDVILSDVTGPPDTVSAIAGDGEATVNWYNPLGPVTTLLPIFYTVTSSPGGFTATTAGDELTATVTGLTNGTEYTFTVISVNAVGNSAPSSPSGSIVIGFVPGAPTNLTAVPADGQITLSWTAPTYTGTSPIITYVVAGPTTINVNGTTFTARFTGLQNNISYQILVYAANSTGYSPSASISTTPGIIPGAPQGVSLVSAGNTIDGNNSVRITWNPSSEFVITYRINVYDSSNNLLPQFNRENSGVITEVNIGGFSIGTLYKFTVTGSNDTGQGPPSSPVSITVYNNPSVIDVSGSVGDGQATISWVPPTDDGGKAIVSYTVYVYNATDNLLETKDVSANILTTIITGLINGTQYQFKVTASNGAISSNLSQPVIVTPGRAPSTPSPSIITAGYDYIDIGWAAPNNGGYTITSYTVYVFDSSDVEIPALNKQVNITSATIEGLTNGLTYKLSVSATNNIGTSAQSSKLTASTSSLNSVPSAPQVVYTNPGIDEVTVNWAPPSSNGGSAITGYRVTIYDASNNSFTDLSENILTKTFTSLNAGLIYNFTVSAINEIGIGTPSNKIPGIPQNVPGAVINLAGSFDIGGNGTLTWSPPSNNGGTPINSYILNGNNIGLFAEPISYTVIAMDGIGPYTYIVRAVNAIGTGPPSTITINFISSPNSVAAKSGYAHAGNTQIYVEWETPYDGGSPITSYTIKIENEYTGASSEYDISGTKTSELISNLINGQAHRVSIKATNIVGSTQYENFIDTGGENTIVFTPSGVPYPPTNVTRVLTENGIIVSWTAPTIIGNSAITNYTVVCKLADNTNLIPQSTGSSATSLIFTELRRGQTYTLRVFATNIRGVSIYSLPSQPILIPATKPDVITSGESTYDATNNEIYLTWTEPNNGGSAITTYTVSSNRGDPITTNLTSVYIPSPTLGVTYIFTITATNAIGTSDPSEPFTVTIPA